MKSSASTDVELTTEFFFPKANPPVVIRAKTREEAEEKFKELQTKK